MKTFCLSIFNSNYEDLKKLNLIPVGLGNENFNQNWMNDKGKINISHKNSNFGEYTFHYKLWKNENLKYSNWIGFCSYRRFWTNLYSADLNSFSNLKKIIIKKPPNNWSNFEVILGSPLIFKKIKNIKLIKRNPIEILKKPSVLFKKNTLEDQFRIFHGSYYLDIALKLLPDIYRDNFIKYLNGYQLHPYNMFICKNTDILYQFYDTIFPWLFECEKIFKDKKLYGYDKQRIYGFLAERFMPFWFLENFKTTTNPISFFDTNLVYRQ